MKRRRVALVLGGGGARGLSHIGVISMLEKFKIPIDIIVGSSAGALVGAMYCAGKLKQFREDMLGMSKSEIYRMFVAKPSPFGLIQHEKVEGFLGKYFKNLKIQDLKKKFACTSFDLISGKNMIITKGNVLKNVLSSIAIPGIFVPVRNKSEIMVDSAFFDPLPVDVAKKLFPDAFIIAIDIRNNKRTKMKSDKLPNIFFTINRILEITADIVTKGKASKTDVLINAEPRIGPMQYHLVEEAIMDGEMAAILSIPKIKKKLGMRL